MTTTRRNRFFFAWDCSGACGHAHKSTTIAAKCARKNGFGFVVKMRTTCADLVRVQDHEALGGSFTELVWDVTNDHPIVRR